MDSTDIAMPSEKDRHLNSFLDRDDPPDCVFIIDDEEIEAHKLVLTRCSPVFEKMFFGEMASDRISIIDISSEDLMEMLRFIYTGNVRIKSVLQAWSLFYIAHKYLLSGLLKVCTIYIQKNTSINTLVLSYEYAEMYEIRDLQKMCMSEIVVYVRGLFHGNCDYHMKPTSIVAILEQRYLNISNDELIEGILQWAVEECDVNNINITPENVMNLLGSSNILQHLVCLNFSVSPKSDKLISQCCQLIKKLNSPCTPFKTYLEKQWCTFCKCRQIYKIAGRMKLTKKNVLISNISVNRNTFLYGLVLVTVDDDTNHESNVSIKIEICPIDNPESVKVTNFTKVFSDESLSYVPLPDLVYLEGGKLYSIKIEYTNLDKSSKSSILCNYMSNRLIDDKLKIVFSFDELDGGVVRGISYYPA